MTPTQKIILHFVNACYIAPTLFTCLETRPTPFGEHALEKSDLPMSGNSDLHAVIHTLTPQESSSFRKTLTTKKRQLFDALLAMPTYDHDALEQAMAPMPRNQLAPNKAQLLHILLAAHRQETSHKSEPTLNEVIQEARFLVSRGLLTLARKRLLPVLGNVQRLEDFFTALDIIALYKQICNELQLKGSPLNLPEIPDSLEQELFAKAKDLLACRMLSNRAMDIINNTESDQIAKAHHITQDLIVYPATKSLSAQIEFSRAAIMMFNFLGKAECVVTFARKGREAIENLPRELYGNEIQILHIKLLFIEIGFSIELGKTASANEARQKLAFLGHDNSLTLYASHKVQTHLIFLKLIDSIRFLNPSTSQTLLSELQDIPPLPYGDRTHTMYIEYLSACLCFYHGWMKESNQRLIRIINDYEWEHNPRVYTMAHFTYLLLWLDREEADHLDYYLGRIKRRLISVNARSEYEQKMLSFFEATKKLTSKQQLYSHYERLQTTLLFIKKDPLSARFLDLFELEPYLVSRLENKDLAELIKKKYHPP